MPSLFGWFRPSERDRQALLGDALQRTGTLRDEDRRALVEIIETEHFSSHQKARRVWAYVRDRLAQVLEEGR